VAAALKDGLGIDAELIEGYEGVFDVALDGKTVFSKKRQGGFIGTPEIVRLVADASRPHRD
jgi:predicted Rdx family selenoprotein